MYIGKRGQLLIWWDSQNHQVEEHDGIGEVVVGYATSLKEALEEEAKDDNFWAFPEVEKILDIIHSRNRQIRDLRRALRK